MNLKIARHWNRLANSYEYNLALGRARPKFISLRNEIRASDGGTSGPRLQLYYQEINEEKLMLDCDKIITSGRVKKSPRHGDVRGLLLVEFGSGAANARSDNRCPQTVTWLGLSEILLGILRARALRTRACTH